MKILIIGATSGIAKECARIWAARSTSASPNSLVLVARNAESLATTSADLRVRNKTAEVLTYASSLTDTEEISRLEPQLRAGGPYDVVLIAQGELTQQSEAQSSVSALHQSLTINATSVAVFAELGARLLEPQGKGTLAIFGSVAGDRTRRSNYSYGAAKAFLASYVNGMRHRFAGTNVNVVIIKPGPTATPMTTALATSGRLAPASAVAADIVEGIAKGKRQIYTPGIWAIIMLVVRLIPGFIFNKLDF